MGTDDEYFKGVDDDELEYGQKIYEGEELPEVKGATIILE